jgi:hypothetical protein
MKPRATIGAVVLALGLSACGGKNQEATTTPTPSATRSETTPGPSALPPEFLDCMADQGYELSPTDDIHAAPPETLQTCFESLHQGG